MKLNFAIIRMIEWTQNQVFLSSNICEQNNYMESYLYIASAYCHDLSMGM